MAKLRANHNRDKNPFIGMTIRVFLMIGIIGIIFFIAMRYFDGAAPTTEVASDDKDLFFTDYKRSHLYPSTQEFIIVDHTYYSLGYSEDDEQAQWVAYVLNRDELKIPNVQRSDRFEDDPFVTTGSATYYDYRGSGYSRGHLAPAGDMAFSETAMRESFYMSNMSPQVIPFNGGIWRELEETVRDWAYSNEHLYILTGPILDDVTEHIGKNKVAVPKYFYKAIVDIDEPEMKGIAFIMPNEKNEQPIMNFAVSIDSLESRLGFDIFPNLLDSQNLENSIESTIQIEKWPVSEKRYKLRIENWNSN